MTKRAFNFNAGPAALPLEVLQQAQEELTEYKGIGMSIMEISHRSKEYEAVNDEAQTLLRELLNIPNDYKVLLLQGGASLQFAMVPMNLLREGQVASYIQTGSWADKAIKEAKLIGEVEIAASSKDDQYTRIPDLNNLKISDRSAYVHLTSNETIGGIQYQQFPEISGVPVVADMSSDILCRPIDVTKFGLIYAGAQKNIGPAGVTVVIIHESLLADLPSHLPVILRYDTHANNNSLYNTPPVFSIYMMNLVLKWIKQNGGLVAMEQRNREKAAILYDAIDRSGGFYRGVAAKEHRSLMNITFRMADEELEKRFVQQSEEHGFVGLKGHRSVGGLRASAYNSVPYESCKALAEFMAEFQRTNG